MRCCGQPFSHFRSPRRPSRLQHRWNIPRRFRALTARFQRNLTLCPSRSVDPALNPCVTHGLINMTCRWSGCRLRTACISFLSTFPCLSFKCSSLDSILEMSPALLPIRMPPMCRSMRTVQHRDRISTPAPRRSPVSAFVNSHLGEPTAGVKFVFSSSAPFDAPPLITFGLDAHSDAANTQQDALSWRLDLTGSAIEAPAPEPVSGLLLGVSIVVLMAAARIGGTDPGRSCVGSRIRRARSVV